MAFFVFPQAWIGPAIMAAAIAFGSVPNADNIQIKYRNLSGQTLGEPGYPRTILIDKRPASQWTREKAQCVIVHEYGHLRNKNHSNNRNSIMHPVLRYPACHRWLVRHGIR